jgi:hypothetical protein
MNIVDCNTKDPFADFEMTAVSSAVAPAKTGSSCAATVARARFASSAPA